MAGSYKPFRRTAIAASAVGLVTIATALTGPGVGAANAGTPVTTATAGTASAIAQSYKVNPTTAQLSIGISFGTSLAGYTNNVAQAESRAIDLGIIGSTLASQGCDGGDPTLAADKQPQSLHADSRDKDAGTQKSESEKYAPVIDKAVEADSSPSATANTTTAALSAAGSPVSIAGAHSQAITHIVDGVREAVATSDISGVTIAGVLELSGLHWTATYRTGGTDTTDGSFTIGALKVLGQSLPVTDVASALEQANSLLSAVGVQIVAPKPHVSAGILFVDPMSIRIVPSSTRDSITGGILGAIQPVRENLYDALLKQDCGNATYITVSDIAIGSITGSGSFSLDLGGVQATSGALKLSNFLLGLLPLPSLGNVSDLPALSDSPILSEAPSATPPPAIVKSNRRNAALAANVDGSRGGRLALVGALGLLALLIVADRDRRLMRHAQRSTPTEV